MRKNQKYRKEETCPSSRHVYPAIELSQESGLPQAMFCSIENQSIRIFSYWLRKYRKETGFSIANIKNSSNIFIPVKISKGGTSTETATNSRRVDISFPNGVQLSCPVGIDIGQL